MSGLSLFVVIQAKDHQLGRALEHLERNSRLSRPRVNNNHNNNTGRSSNVMAPRTSSAPPVPELANPGQSLAQNTADRQRVEPADYNNNNCKDSAASSQSQQYLLPVHQPRPLTPSCDSDPRTTAPTSDYTAVPATSSSFSSSVNQTRQRNRSPFSRTAHLHSRSSTTTATMARAQSLPPRSTSPFSPSLSSGRLSPLPRSPKRSGSPFRSISRESEQSTTTSPFLFDGFEDIPEDGELDLSTPSTDRSFTPAYHTSLKPSRSLSGRRQRPTSPVSGQLTTSASSPALSSASARYNETFPGLHHYGSYSSISSMPSTPSSNRSRSPSISSLETIEDVPDLEYQAIEAERLAKIKASSATTDDVDEQDEEPQRRSSLEIPGQRPVGFGFGRQNQRKRWSVCGAERRADLDLETIWED